MRLLLDTVALLCAVANPERMSPSTVEMIGDNSNQVLVSAASAWELSTKYRLGKLDQAERLVLDWTEVCADLQFEELAVSASHALRGGGYEVDHRDPFDRIICAQGELEAVSIVTNDSAFSLFPVKTIW